MSEPLPSEKQETLLDTKEASIKTRRAFICGIAGAVLLVSSFALTFFLSHHDRSFTFALYGLTMLGVTIVFASCVMFFE